MKEYMNDVICDECEERFSISIRVRKHRGGIKESYFICPKCKKEYTVLYTNRATREIQRKIQDLREEIKKYPSKTEKIMKQYRKLVKKNTEMSKTLFKEISSVR